MVWKIVACIVVGVLDYFITKTIVMVWIDQWHDKKEKQAKKVEKPQSEEIKERRFVVASDTNICVMCGDVIPEGDLVCKKCREEILGDE